MVPQIAAVLLLEPGESYRVQDTCKKSTYDPKRSYVLLGRMPVLCCTAASFTAAAANYALTISAD